VKLATITAVYNEEDLLPQFLRHYDGQGVDRCFILDNESTDRSVEIASKHPKVELSAFVTPGIGFDGPKHHAIMKKMLECQGHYDLVILVDADELIVPAKPGTIRSAIESLPLQYDLYTTEGYSMMQTKDDADYNPDVPLPLQQKNGFFDRLYSKPAIVNPVAQAVFSMGIHSASGVLREKSMPGLFKLLHYAAPSEAIFLKRRLQKEPRVHQLKARKDEAYFKKLYWEWRANPELSTVL
jgi:glycosyltransferase involved in cell wall biosynthesis